MSGNDPGIDLSEGWDRSGLTLAELWLGYIAIGGTASRAEVEAYVHGAGCPDSYEYNMIAQVLNEHFIDRGEDHPVRYHDIPVLP
jgi:hypothetical protein